MFRRLQKTLCLALVALLAAATMMPALAASRVEAYVTQRTYIYKSASTSSSCRSIAANTKVYVVGKSGSFAKIQNARGTATAYILSSNLSGSSNGGLVKKSGGSGSWKSRVEKLNWFKEGQYLFRTGSYAYMYDIDTGIAIKIKRMGGHYHADVEPATSADTAKLLRIARGKFSWDSHAVILKVGDRFIACGINTLPHGDQTITNNGYNGQFCLHMSGSLTHASSKENNYHQVSVKRAYNWAHR